MRQVLRDRRVVGMIIVAVLGAIVAAPVAAQQRGQQQGPERFESRVVAFEQQDQTTPPPANPILFVGSATIRGWDLPKYFPDLKQAMNRGLGGSRLDDVMHYFDRIVSKYKPPVIVMYCGDNDVQAGDSAEQVVAETKAFVERVHAGNAKTRIVYISLRPSQSRWDKVEVMRKANQMLKQYVAGDPRLYYVDIEPLMLGEDGKPRPELFVADQLHLTPLGFEVWTKATRPVLDKALSDVARDGDSARASRFESQIAQMEARDQTSPPPANPIVFVGSSSIRRWDVAKSFPDLPVINRGFGGSQVADSVFFCERIVLKYKPPQVVFYAGDNDLPAGKTPEQLASDFKQFVDKVHRALPETEIIFVSIKPSVRRWSIVEKIRKSNALVKELTKNDPKLIYLDIEPAMLNADGTPRPDLYVTDGLHLNDQGYEIWAKLVRPLLKPKS